MGRRSLRSSFQGPPPPPPGGRIHRESDSEQTPEYGDVGLLGWAQHVVVGLREEVHAPGIHGEVHKPLVLQEEAQDCGEHATQPPAWPAQDRRLPTTATRVCRGLGTQLLPSASTAVSGQVSSWNGVSRGTDNGFSSLPPLAHLGAGEMSRNGIGSLCLPLPRQPWRPPPPQLAALSPSEQRRSWSRGCLHPSLGVL